MRREVAFDEDLECVADSFRVFVAERADALLQFGERMQVIVQASPYQQFRVWVLRWHDAVQLSTCSQMRSLDFRRHAVWLTWLAGSSFPLADKIVRRCEPTSRTTYPGARKKVSRSQPRSAVSAHARSGDGA
jgi:hypothetical protein